MLKCKLCGEWAVRTLKRVWCKVTKRYVTVVVYRCVKCGEEA